MNNIKLIPVSTPFCDHIKYCMGDPSRYSLLPHPILVDAAKLFVAKGYTPESIADVMCGSGKGLVKRA